MTDITPWSVARFIVGLALVLFSSALGAYLHDDYVYSGCVPFVAAICSLASGGITCALGVFIGLLDYWRRVAYKND